MPNQSHPLNVKPSSRRVFLNAVTLVAAANVLPANEAKGEEKPRKRPAVQGRGGAEVDQVSLRRRGVGLIAIDRQKSAGGYSLFTPQTDSGNVYLIDINGKVAHTWKLPNRPGRHCVLLPN